MRLGFHVVLAMASSVAFHQAAAQSSAPAARSRAVSDTVRVGTYDLELTTDDGTLTGALTIKPAATGVAAAITVGGHGPEVKSFKRVGAGYALEGGAPDFTVSYKFTFANDSLHGSFEMSTGMKGTVLGARKH